MRILLMGSSRDVDSKQYGNLAGFNHGFSRAFEELGHEVVSMAHADDPGIAVGEFDFFLLRDTTVSVKRVADLAAQSNKFAMFTHAEFIQGQTIDRHFFRNLAAIGRWPDHLFLDQPLAKLVYDKIGVTVPSTFLGWGANPVAYRKPWAEKDIDVLWVGHAYGERQPRVTRVIYPLLEKEDLVVRIHGRGQEHGPLSMPEMFDVLARAKIVVRLSHKAHWLGGYSGRTIYDALASGCYVVHDKYPTCEEHFPLGVQFADVEGVGRSASRALEDDELLLRLAAAGYVWVKANGMIAHKAQAMLKILGLEG